MTEVDCEYEEKCEGIKQKKKTIKKTMQVPFYTKSLQKKNLKVQGKSGK